MLSACHSPVLNSFIQIELVEFMHIKDASTIVQLVDCVWEFFVIVGSEARAQRQNIRIALHVASVSVLPPSV